MTPYQQRTLARRPHRVPQSVPLDPASQPPPRRIPLRTTEQVKLCRGWSPRRLMNGEAMHLKQIAADLGTKHVGCRGKTFLQHCTLGAGVAGYTTIDYCREKCGDYTPVSEE